MRPLALLATLVLLTPAFAQVRHPAARPGPAANTTQLPITRVALYKNGVGFFEHAGRVTGDQSVTIDFTSAQLNDVLQSLTALDLSGGRISGAGYNSTTPLNQQLKTLPLALSTNPSDVDFYNAIRGARVQVTAPGLSISGRLLAIDLRTQTRKNPDSSIDETGNRRFLTVVSDSGTVRTFELTSSTSVILLDTALHIDVTRYLELLASTRNQGLRHLTLLDRGTGSRDLRVSYISEVPVWKSTYRILFTDAKSDQTATLQGWSVVDNTTGSDWINVHLDLIAGAPQSFLQPLSTPYYARRPEIPLPAEAQLTPQTHESGDMATVASVGIHGLIVDQNGAIIPNAQITISHPATGARIDAASQSDGSFTVALPQPGAYQVQISVPGFKQQIQMVNVDREQMAELTFRLDVGAVSQSVEVNALRTSPKAAGVVGLLGMAGGSAGGVLGGIPAGMGSAQATIIRAAPIDYAQAAQASLTPQTTTSAFDDFFEYTLTDPITIRKNESALVPILQTKLPIERVTLWSRQQPVALRALWLTNSSTLTLDRGSFAIVENGSFGGEGLLDPIHPGEKRLLSYAADQAVRVTESAFSNNRHVNRLQISKGVLTETSTSVAELTYDVRNAAPEPRTVLLEHPVRQGWELTSAAKPAETTPTAYRFRLLVPSAQTAHLHVAERHTDFEYIRLIDRTEDQLLLLLRNAKANPATMAALQPVFDAHHAVLALDEQIGDRDAEIASITADQTRLRENMKALKGSPEEKALLSRYTGELNAQEDRLNALNQQLGQLRTQRAAADQEFQNKLQAVSLDETLE